MTSGFNNFFKKIFSEIGSPDVVKDSSELKVFQSAGITGVGHLPSLRKS